MALLDEYETEIALAGRIGRHGLEGGDTARRQFRRVGREGPIGELGAAGVDQAGPQPGYRPNSIGYVGDDPSDDQLALPGFNKNMRNV